MGLELTTIQSKFIRCHQPPAEWFPVNHLNHSCHSCFCGNTWASPMESTSVTGSGWICIHSGNREHGPTAKCSRFSKDGLGRTTHLERRVPLTLGFARNMRILGKESFTASNRLANCSKLKRGTLHSFFSFLAFGIADEFCCKTPRNSRNQISAQSHGIS